MPDGPSPLDPLMARLADGDREAFTGVFEQLWPPTLRLCRSLLGSEADAADAAQEALYKIFQRASDYDKSRPALPWALAIAAWECRTINKRRQRQRETAEPNLEERAEQAGEHAEEHVVEKDLMSAALSALGELSEADRETLVATFWDEAASASGATLRKRRQRALDRLRQAWKRLYGLD